jgi:hypothetical protein
VRQDVGPPAGRDAHTAGFGHALAVLAAAGAAAEVGPLAERLADAIVTAFNTGDDAERRRLLERAWAPAAVFRGPMANATGCDGLDAHIANARRHGGGGRVVRVGPVRAGHRHLAWSWRIEDDGGRAWATGTDLAEVGLDGRLAWLTGLWDPPAVTSAENC